MQVGHFLVLPDVGAGGAASAVLMSMLPLLISIWRQPDPACFARCVALASLNGYDDVLPPMLREQWWLGCQMLHCLLLCFLWPVGMPVIQRARNAFISVFATFFGKGLYL